MYMKNKVIPQREEQYWQPLFFFKILDSSILRVVNLISGQVCYMISKSPYNYKIYLILIKIFLHIHEYMKKVYKSGIGIFMYLNGENSSTVMLYSLNLFKKWKINWIFADKFGDIDIGFKRIIVFLSKDRLENGMDNLLLIIRLKKNLLS